MENVYNFELLQDRARYCSDLAGSASRLANEAGISRTQVWRIIENGSDMTTDTIRRMADAVGVDPGWLVTGRGQPHAGKTDEKKPVSVVEFASESLCPILFNRTYFCKHISSNPDSCCAFRINDQELERLEKDAWCIADETQKKGLDGYYLIESSAATHVRYLEFIPTGAIHVLADRRNKKYVLNKDEAASINIIGRVVWWETLV